MSSPTRCFWCRPVSKRRQARCPSHSTISQRIPRNATGSSPNPRSCREPLRSSSASPDRFTASLERSQRDVELSGHSFCPGESVIVNYASANRDATEFPDPDRCILDRQANRHLGFGAGVHRCLGSNLARLEFHIGLEQVLSRMPDCALAPDATAHFHGNSVTRGFRQIPVVFSPGKRSTLAATG